MNVRCSKSRVTCVGPAVRYGSSASLTDPTLARSSSPDRAMTGADGSSPVALTLAPGLSATATIAHRRAWRQAPAPTAGVRIQWFVLGEVNPRPSRSAASQQVGGAASSCWQSAIRLRRTTVFLLGRRPDGLERLNVAGGWLDMRAFKRSHLPGDDYRPGSDATALREALRNDYYRALPYPCQDQGTTPSVRTLS